MHSSSSDLKSLLQSCTNFKAVYTLKDYLNLLSSIQPLNDYPISDTFETFIESTLICLDNSYTLPSPSSISLKYTYCTLIDGTISTLLTKKSNENALRLEDHVQTLGYSLYKPTSNLRKNPMITLTLKSPDWENLHKYIGSELMIHIIKSQGLAIFIQKNEALVQVLGINIAKYLKTKDCKSKKSFVCKTMKEFKASYEKCSEKQDILAKLPLINKGKMLYNTLIRKKFKLPNRNLLNLTPWTAGHKIAEKIIGAKSVNKKYSPALFEFFGKFAYKYQRLNLGAHINKHCALPEGFKKSFELNKKENFSFEWLFNSHCTLSQVSAYLITVLKKVIPKGLFSPRNLKALIKGVIMFLKLGVWEKYSCTVVCSRFKMADFTWIQEFADSARLLLVGKIVLFIFNDFIIPLLQCSFYITEKQHDNTILYFYRKPVWSVISSQVKEKLEKTNFFSQLNQEEANRWQEFTKFPPAKLRIQPKSQDFRPIMHFKSRLKIGSGNVCLSGNNLIAGVPQILRNCLQDPEKVMSLDYPSLITKISNFTDNWTFKGKPKLFFMCFDIAKAFDSVSTEDLITMIEDLEVPPVAAFYKYIQLLPRHQHQKQGLMQSIFKMKYKKQAISEGISPFFTDLNLRPGSINVLTARTNFATGEKLRMVSRVLQGNVIRFNRQLFKGLKGVPQGLPCSPLLSNLYYSNIEEKLIPELYDKYSDELLLIIRLHDDYLILANKAEIVTDSFKQLEKLANMHSFQFASNKIISSVPGPWTQKSEIEGWVGLEINEEMNVVPHVSENAKRQISFDFISRTVTSTDLKNKLIKMTNLTINLLRFRSLADESSLQSALEKLINLQACRFLMLLKIVRKAYGQKHSNNAISRIIVNVMKFSANLCCIQDFFVIGVKGFVKVFKGTEMNGVACKLNRYLEKLNRMDWE